MKRWQITQHRDIYQQGIERLIPRYDKYNNIGRAYVEKQWEGSMIQCEVLLLELTAEISKSTVTLFCDGTS